MIPKPKRGPYKTNSKYEALEIDKCGFFLNISRVGWFLLELPLTLEA